MTKITREELIEELVRLSEKVDGSPTKDDMNERGQYSISPYYREFEGWNDALKVSGLSLNKAHKIPEEELIQELNRVSNITDRVPTRSDMEEVGEYSAMPYSRQFGSWNDALIEAGFELNCRIDIPTRNLLQELRGLSVEIEKTPTQSDMIERGDYSASVYLDRFGSWNESLGKVGLKPHTRRDIPRAELLDELNRLSKELGRPPTASEMNNIGEFSERPYLTQFGSWNGAVLKAGLEPENKYGLSNEDLLLEMSRLREQIEKSPRVEDMAKLGDYSPGTYERRFGSWNNALLEADLLPTKPSDISNDELVEEMQRLAVETGEQPKYDDMLKSGKYSSRMYEKRFGSWNDALIEAGFEPREPLSGPDHPHWDGGGQKLYRKLRTFYGSRTWKTVRESVLERDGNECQFKECDSGLLAVHHIVPVLGGGTNSEEVLMSLCPRHHKIVEQYTKENIVRPVIADIVEGERQKDVSVEPDSVQTTEQSTLQQYT